MSDIKILILNNEVSLDHVCWDCQGDGYEEITSSDKIPCETCSGKGYQLTAAGRSIIDRVRRHG